VIDHDGRAVSGQTSGDSLADAGRGAGDDHDLVLERQRPGLVPALLKPIVQSDRGVLAELGGEAALAAKPTQVSGA
jgi:hypothetical protein